MKQYKLFATFFALAALVFFSSCENNDFYRRSSLNAQTDILTDRYGAFNYRFTIYDTDIADYRPSREELLDINTIDAWLEISSDEFIQGDVIGAFTIEAEGVGRYDNPGGYIVRNNPNVVFEIGDNGYYDFMRNVMYRILTSGYVNMRIYGSTIYESAICIF